MRQGALEITIEFYLNLKGILSAVKCKYNLRKSSHCFFFVDKIKWLNIKWD